MQNQCNLLITFDNQLKTALRVPSNDDSMASTATQLPGQGFVDKDGCITTRCCTHVKVNLDSIAELDLSLALFLHKDTLRICFAIQQDRQVIVKKPHQAPTSDDLCVRVIDCCAIHAEFVSADTPKMNRGQMKSHMSKR